MTTEQGASNAVGEQAGKAGGCHPVRTALIVRQGRAASSQLRGAVMWQLDPAAPPALPNSSSRDPMHVKAGPDLERQQPQEARGERLQLAAPDH